ncbi:hypothetical protein LAZ67_4003347 [Cordylochernes scorpioides]|uniref:Uncharacterized protein n=1 Tax=Cordylochernes scorpioides TaxID=51811 RepID=A0ABY6KEJ2_9ARAC|nr:hypothetical protein LAZ67_4003347 [Cordylochernes scorpioides]
MFPVWPDRSSPALQGGPPRWPAMGLGLSALCALPDCGLHPVDLLPAPSTLTLEDQGDHCACGGECQGEAAENSSCSTRCGPLDEKLMPGEKDKKWRRRTKLRGGLQASCCLTRAHVGIPGNELAKSGALGLPEARKFTTQLDERDLLCTIKTQCLQEWKSTAAHDWYKAGGTSTISVLPKEQVFDFQTKVWSSSDNDFPEWLQEKEKKMANYIQVAAPEGFNFGKPNEWPIWFKRFQRYRIASELSEKSESEQVNALIYIMGDKAEEILILFNLSEAQINDYKLVVSKFQDYFIGKRNVIYERAKFNRRSQGEMEPVEEFITNLYVLAETCSYGILKEEMIRDRLVVGVKNLNLSEKLQLESELTLEKAIQIVRQSESVKNQQKEIRQDTENRTWM